MDFVSYVSRLNEYAQKERVEVKYEEVGWEGLDHVRTFSIRVVINDKAYPAGVGSNKKEAKHNAAKNALELLLDKTAESLESVPEAPAAQVQLKLNYVSWLNEYTQRNKLCFKSIERTRLEANAATQLCCFVLEDKEYPGASARTKKEAREEAARLVFQEIMGKETMDSEDGADSGTSSLRSDDVFSDVSDKMKRLSLKMEHTEFAETNSVSMLHNHCQQKGMSCVFVQENRCGPSHTPRFFYKAVIDNQEFPVGEGKNVKEAKQNAARLAWSAINKPSDGENRVCDVAQTRVTPPPSQDPVTPSKTDQIVVINASNSPNVQIKSPVVKPKIKIAANFEKVSVHSKEDLVNFNCKKEEKVQRPEAPTQLALRFSMDYDCITPLDKGAFGCVFKARHRLEDKYYAVKVVRYKEKTLREVKVLSDLSHSNIVRYHSCWLDERVYHWDSSADSSSASHSSSDSTGKVLCIQMELCDKINLRLWIDGKNVQNPKKSMRDLTRREESLDLMLQIVSGVEYIHSKKLIHRDLKPSNILFSHNGTVKIGDFGLVASEIEDDPENQIERRRIKGTPSYMAPEQKDGILYDHKVDIFALGLILFELLWNIPTASEKSKIWPDVRNQMFPQEFPRHFHQESVLIKSMLCAKPEERPAATEIHFELQTNKCSIEKLKTQSENKTVV